MEDGVDDHGGVELKSLAQRRFIAFPGKDTVERAGERLAFGSILGENRLKLFHRLKPFRAPSAGGDGGENHWRKLPELMPGAGEIAPPPRRPRSPLPPHDNPKVPHGTLVAEDSPSP